MAYGGPACSRLFPWQCRIEVQAVETFNDGLRAYYFAFAAIGWFISSLVFMLATVGEIYILYQREFQYDVLAVLNS